MMTVEPKPAKPAIDSLWTAFAAAQAEFGAIAKSATGARASQKYAPLDCVLDIVRPTLNAHGLVLTQVPVIDGEALLIRTVLVHSPTGETHECIYPAGPITAAHQALGAGVTYARRYSLLALLGVFPADEDDDGAEPAFWADADATISESDLKDLHRRIEVFGADFDMVKFCKVLAVDRLPDLRKSQLANAIAKIDAKAKKLGAEQ